MTRTVIERSAEGVHEVCLDLVRTEQCKRILDAAAGHGAFSAKLHDLGFDVTAVDYSPGEWKADNVDCLQIDLQVPMMFGDASFDCVVRACFKTVPDARV